MATILTVDDESGIRAFIADALEDAGHRVVQAGNGSEALAQLRDRPFDLAIFDLRMPGEMGGMDLVRWARAEWPQMQVIVLTAFGTVAGAVEALRLGAFDFLEKPLPDPDTLRRLVTRALNWRGAAASDPVERVVPSAIGAPVPAPVPRWRIWRIIRRFSGELKRRRVYNVAATYAATVYLALQVAQLILPALPLPSWSYTALVVLAAGGFPAALVLGWMYDVTILRADVPEAAPGCGAA